MAQIVQRHHIIYENKEHKQKDFTVDLYKGEHWCITQLQRRKYITKGFIKALEFWILLNRDSAVDAIHAPLTVKPKREPRKHRLLPAEHLDVGERAEVIL